MALMGLAEEKQSLERIAEDLHELEATIQGSRELKVVLMNPVVTPDRKLSLLTELFGKRFDPMTISFIALLVRKGRAEFLLATAEEFLEMLDAKRNILRAKISSAVSLTEAEQMEMQAKLESLTGKRIRAEFTLDSALRGGFVARIGDQLIDASLSHQIEMLREQFKRGGSPILN
jgi:F-type H+-transporting ATPase subunit delta